MGPHSDSCCQQTRTQWLSCSEWRRLGQTCLCVGDTDALTAPLESIAQTLYPDSLVDGSGSDTHHRHSPAMWTFWLLSTLHQAPALELFRQILDQWEARVTTAPMREEYSEWSWTCLSKILHTQTDEAIYCHHWPCGPAVRKIEFAVSSILGHPVQYPRPAL